MPFPYKTVLITGATAGIGQALAECLISAGVFVIAVGRRRDRLDELAARFGDKIAVEEHDVANLENLPAWAKHITTTYPSLDCIVLNAGVQNTTSFASLTQAEGGGPNDPGKLAATISAEMTLNYLSPVHSIVHFLPHLSSLSTAKGLPTAVVLVSSGLALVPMSRCGNYCATKAALHSFAWTLRSQLAAANTRVVEIVPPAVKTELHSRQADLVAAGLGSFGMELDEFTDEVWAALSGEEEVDEILVGPVKRHEHLEDGRREGFKMMEKSMRETGGA